MWKANLVVRLGPQAYHEALAAPAVVEFDITGRPMRGWVMVEPEGLDDDAQLRTGIDRAVQFVRTLPPK